MEPKWIKTKLWKPSDLACLKWSCIFFGMILGAYLSDWITRYLWFFVIAVIVLAIKPVVSYFRNDQ
jgi:hypothetical protein